MDVIDPGHEYLLNNLDVEPGTFFPPSVLMFVKREGEGYPGNIGHHPGTNMQEVLRALIARIKYLHNQIPDNRNLEVINFLRGSLYWLEHRAAERHGRLSEFVNDYNRNKIESYSVCLKCGHIGCKGSCH